MSIMNPNEVNGLNLEDLLICGENATTGEKYKYMPVRNRVLWFRMVRPDGDISTEMVHIFDKPGTGGVLFKATVTSGTGVILATGHASCLFDDPKFGIHAYEAAESMAIGRALSNAGFGTQYCGKEMDTPLVDTPEPIKETTPVPCPVTEKPGSGNSDILSMLLNGAVPSQDFEEQVAKEMKTMTKVKAGGLMITYGPHSMQTIKDVYKACTKEDKVADLRPYAYDKTSNDARVVAACRYFVEQYDTAAVTK